MISTILHNGQLLALIISHRFSEPGVHFFTPDEQSQQLAFMRHPAGKEIPPHLHNPVPREVLFTQEVLLIRRGKLQVDFYDDERNYLESRILEAGDTILLATGGHGFRVLEELEMIEVKQGPYAGELDKIRFASVDQSLTRIAGQDGESCGQDDAGNSDADQPGAAGTQAGTGKDGSGERRK